MIRVRVESPEKIPDSLIASINASREVEIDEKDFDVRLIFVKNWNPAALLHIQQSNQSKPQVIICEQYEEPFSTDSLLRQHVSGVLLITAQPLQLILALRAAAAGLKFLQPLKSRNKHLYEYQTLTSRELEILRLVADGEANKSIADLLKISEHTVKFHISSIFQKLNVSSRTEAIRTGITRGLISI